MIKNIIVPCLAIVTLGALEAIALLNGIDGALFMTIAAIIGGIAGYEVKQIRKSKNEG